MPFPLAPWARKGPARSSGQGAQSGVGLPSGRWHGTAGNGDALTPVLRAAVGSKALGLGSWLCGERGRHPAPCGWVSLPVMQTRVPQGPWGSALGCQGVCCGPSQMREQISSPGRPPSLGSCVRQPPPLKPGVSDTLTQCNLIACDLWSQQKGYQRPHPGNKSKFRHGCKH